MDRNRRQMIQPEIHRPQFQYRTVATAFQHNKQNKTQPIENHETEISRFRYISANVRYE